MKEKEIKVKLELTEGYQKRYTQACCRVLARREKKLEPPDLPERKEKPSEKAVV